MAGKIYSMGSSGLGYRTGQGSAFDGFDAGGDPAVGNVASF